MAPGGNRRLRSASLVRRVASERGAAMVEFALVLPLLLLLVFGMMDFGIALNYWLDENHLASQGARLASVDQNPGPGTLQEYIRSQAETGALRDGGTASLPGPLKVCVSFPAGTADVGDPVKVTVSTSYNWLPFVGHSLDALSIPLEGSATMRLELAPETVTAGCTS